MLGRFFYGQNSIKSPLKSSAILHFRDSKLKNFPYKAGSCSARLGLPNFNFSPPPPPTKKSFLRPWFIFSTNQIPFLNRISHPASSPEMFQQFGKSFAHFPALLLVFHNFFSEYCSLVVKVSFVLFFWSFVLVSEPPRGGEGQGATCLGAPTSRDPQFEN